MSSVSTLPLWGRAWKLSVKVVTADPNSPAEQVLSFGQWDPEALRVTFDILETTLPSPFWYADIAVWNCNKAEIQNLLLNAVWVTFEAGYQTGPSKSSIIWDGPVLQVLYDQEDVVNKIIHFNCLAGPWLLEEQFINTSLGPFSSQMDTVVKMVNQTNGNTSDQVSSYATGLLSAKKYPRGKTIFGKVSKYIGQMSDDNFLNHWLDGNQSYISELSQPNASLSPSIVYSPPFPPDFNFGPPNPNVTYSIIGVPIQTPFGCDYTVLLDPRLKVQLPPLLTKLDRSLIRQLKVQYGQVLTPLDQDGLYIAAQIRHHGDTRGNPWYTDVSGYNPAYAQGLLRGTFLAQSTGVQ
jgi:hypothetical protein